MNGDQSPSDKLARDRKPLWWHLLDRAYKIMEQSGYRVMEHNPDQNDPIGAWMSDARVILRSVPERESPILLQAARDMLIGLNGCYPLPHDERKAPLRALIEAIDAALAGRAALSAERATDSPPREALAALYRWVHSYYVGGSYLEDVVCDLLEDCYGKDAVPAEAVRGNGMATDARLAHAARSHASSNIEELRSLLREARLYVTETHMHFRVFGPDVVNEPCSRCALRDRIDAAIDTPIAASAIRRSE